MGAPKAKLSRTRPFQANGEPRRERHPLGSRRLRGVSSPFGWKSAPAPRESTEEGASEAVVGAAVGPRRRPARRTTAPL